MIYIIVYYYESRDVDTKYEQAKNVRPKNLGRKKGIIKFNTDYWQMCHPYYNIANGAVIAKLADTS